VGILVLVEIGVGGFPVHFVPYGAVRLSVYVDILLFP